MTYAAHTPPHASAPRIRPPAGAPQHGSTLIEVMVALLLLSLTLLGTSALQSRAQHAGLDAYQRTQALLLARDMVDRISTNRRAALCYDTMAGTPEFIGTGNAPTPCTGWGTTATRERADEDLAQWSALLVGVAETLDGNNVGSITGARGCIEHRLEDLAGDGTEVDVFVVTVAWQGQQPTRAPAGNPCAEGQYGDEALRRVIALPVRLGRLN